MNRRTFLAAAATSTVALAAPAPKPTPKYELVLIEFATEPGRAVIDGRRLVRLPVADGVADKPVEVMKWTEHFFVPPVGYRLLADRFVVTSQAAVIDLTAGKTIHEPKGAVLLGTDGDRVIYRVDLPKSKAGVYAFDPAKQTATKLDDPGGWSLPGARSPDGSKSVARGKAGDLIVHTADGDPTSLGRGYKIDFSPLSSVFLPPPVLWVDDKHFLTQVGNGRLVAVDVTTVKRGEEIEAPAKREVMSAPRLWRDAEGNVLYECGEGIHRIDVKAGKAVAYEWHQLGHEFDVSVAHDGTDGHTFRHDGKEIGKGFGDVEAAVAAPDRLAYIGWPPKDPTKFRQRSLEDEETRVWSAGKWLTPPMKTDTLIGWVRV